MLINLLLIEKQSFFSFIYCFKTFNISDALLNLSVDNLDKHLFSIILYLVFSNFIILGSSLGYNSFFPQIMNVLFLQKRTLFKKNKVYNNSYLVYIRRKIFDFSKL